MFRHEAPLAASACQGRAVFRRRFRAGAGPQRPEERARDGREAGGRGMRSRENPLFRRSPGRGDDVRRPAQPSRRPQHRGDAEALHLQPGQRAAVPARTAGGCRRRHGGRSQPGFAGIGAVPGRQGRRGGFRCAPRKVSHLRRGRAGVSRVAAHDGLGRRQRISSACHDAPPAAILADTPGRLVSNR